MFRNFPYWLVCHQLHHMTPSHSCNCSCHILLRHSALIAKDSGNWGPSMIISVIDILYRIYLQRSEAVIGEWSDQAVVGVSVLTIRRTTTDSLQSGLSTGLGHRPLHQGHTLPHRNTVVRVTPITEHLTITEDRARPSIKSDQVLFRVKATANVV